MGLPDTLHARTKVFARDNPWRSWWCIISTAFLLTVTLTGTFPIVPVAVRIVCSALSGLLMIRLFVIYHDQQHRAILPKSKVAEFFMRLYGIWVLCPSSIWRTSHDYHHAHNSKLRSAYIGSYPVMTREQFDKSSPGDRFRYLALRHPLTIIGGFFTVFLAGMSIFPFLNSPRKHYDGLLALVLLVTQIVVIVLLFGWWTMFLFLLFPRMLGGALGSYLFYAQHNFPDVTYGDKDGWTFEKAALESSSYLKCSPIMAWFVANIGYHHIHHLNHRIPFYRLPEVYRAIPELQKAKITTLKPADVLRCLSLKVWCVKSQRMLALNSL